MSISNVTTLKVRSSKSLQAKINTFFFSIVFCFESKYQPKSKRVALLYKHSGFQRLTKHFYYFFVQSTTFFFVLNYYNHVIASRGSCLRNILVLFDIPNLTYHSWLGLQSFFWAPRREYPSCCTRLLIEL